MWDERIDVGDTLFAKFIDLDTSTVLAEGTYTVGSATSGIAGALAGLVACISLFFF